MLSRRLLLGNARLFSTSLRCSTHRATHLTNILAQDVPPPVQVASISEQNGIQLANGLILPGACIFLEGNVYLWDAPKQGLARDSWKYWSKDHLMLFDTVVPRPELLLLGTGNSIKMPPPFFREYLRDLGIGLDVMDSRNACSTYNILSEEGRRVAAALLPLSAHEWAKNERPAMRNVD